MDVGELYMLSSSDEVSNHDVIEDDSLVAQ